jgi:DeoR family transcriptional regulator, glycerol-3-phosphate regulon repressor
MANDSKIRANHREVEVLEALRQLGGAARNANLAELLGVSEETIRRTTKALAKADLVRRVHGGSYLPDSGAGDGVFSRLGLRQGEKGRIGAAVVALIPDGSCVFMDVGSTTAFVAQALNARRGLDVVTNSLNAAQALAEQGGNRVFVAGGRLRRDQLGMFGSDTIEFIQNFNIDVAIMSVDAIDARRGFLLTGAGEVAVARAVIRQADQTIVVADHQKFGQKAPLVLCPPKEIDVVVTDQPLKAGMAQSFLDWGITAYDASLDAAKNSNKDAA